jgi:hypothetical protein
MRNQSYAYNDLLASDSLGVKGHEMPTCTLCIVTVFSFRLLS